MLDARSLFEYTQLVRKRSPLVHCITNQVASNFTANVLLSIGAAPAMVLAPEQVEEFVGVAEALSVNLGTLNAEQRRAIDLATTAANKCNLPWVLDPVGIGLNWTREFAFGLLEKQPTVIRANASEIITLGGGQGKGRGANSTQTSLDALSHARKLSQRGSITCVTGEDDYIVCLNKIVKLSNGDGIMTKVTALGCSLSSVVAAYLAVSHANKFEASIAALAHVSLAGELAAKKSQFPGSFAVAFLDQLNSLAFDDYEKYLKLEIMDLSVYLVLDPDQCGGHERCVELAKKALIGGVTILQLRAPDWHKKALLELANDLIKLTREFNVPFLIDDHVDVALACGADGVHVGQRDVSPRTARQLMGHNKIIGYSVSNKDELFEANKLEHLIDYIGVGPIFSTPTKPDHNPPIGLDGLKHLCSMAKYPTVAIGGINLGNGENVLKSGTNGLAVVSAICMSEDPQKASEHFAQLFNTFGRKADKVPYKITTIPSILTIAGSDSSGGAGIQADLKTFGALDTYGLSVLTTLTAQNPQEVRAIRELDAEFVKCQLETVFDGCKIDGVKIGALANEEIIHVVAEVLKKRQPTYIVLDPVIVTTSDYRLLSQTGIHTLIKELFSLATLITPNLPESAVLLNVKMAENEKEMIEQGRKLLSLGANAVLMKGGHLNNGSDDCSDWLIMHEKEVKFEGKRIIKLKSGRKIGQIHGTGCTLSSAIAVNLAKSNGDLETSIRNAKSYLNSAIYGIDQLSFNNDPVPLNHFYSSI